MGNSANSEAALMRCAAFACGVGVAYFLAACLSFGLTLGVGGIATIWPASGILVSGLLLGKPSQTLPIISAVALASFVANLLFDASPMMALVFTFANVVEGLLISQLIIRSVGVPRMLDDARWLMAFFGATIVGSAASGTIATALAGGLSFAFFVSWFMTVCLGTLVVTPLIVTIARDWRTQIPDMSSGKELKLFLMLASVAMISLLALTFEEGRFLFLPVISVVAATYAFGSRGAALNISVIAIIATVLTDFAGPTIGHLGLSSETLFLQFYLLSLLCAAWPLSALMSQKAKLIEQYADANELLKMAESTARVGHWSLGPDNTSLVWSEEVYRIHGLDSDALQFDRSLDLEQSSSLRHYHPDDRERVRALLIFAMERHESFAYDARIIKPDGSVRYVSSTGHPRYSSDGEFEGLFGTFQDNTEQTETLEALRMARSEAMSEAETARRLAETDELTGIANRRKALVTLRAAARSASLTEKPLTIAIFDIDHFKAVNDRHGHHVGDEVLKRVATIVSDQLCTTDLVGRLGGEEFLVILPGQDADSGYKIIERVRLSIAAAAWPTSGLSSVTVSAGLAAVSDRRDVENALQRADKALYQAKEDGRNQLRTAA